MYVTQIYPSVYSNGWTWYGERKAERAAMFCNTCKATVTWPDIEGNTPEDSDEAAARWNARDAEQDGSCCPFCGGAVHEDYDDWLATPCIVCDACGATFSWEDVEDDDARSREEIAERFRARG